MSNYNRIVELLGDEAESLLGHTCETIERDHIHLPGPDWVDRIFGQSDRPIPVLRSLQQLFSHGRLGDSGYLSILPVDQGIEHTAGASFGPNPMYFDPENIVRLALEAGCNGVASTLGVLSMVARKYAHKIPFVLKINHNELLNCARQMQVPQRSGPEGAENEGGLPARSPLRSTNAGPATVLHLCQYHASARFIRAHPVLNG